MFSLPWYRTELHLELVLKKLPDFFWIMLSKSSARARGSCVLAIRLAKIGCIAAIGFYVALVAFGNITDYWTNFGFVTNVLDMDEVLPCLAFIGAR